MCYLKTDNFTIVCENFFPNISVSNMFNVGNLLYFSGTLHCAFNATTNVYQYDTVANMFTNILSNISQIFGGTFADSTCLIGVTPHYDIVGQYKNQYAYSVGNCQGLVNATISNVTTHYFNSPGSLGGYFYFMANDYFTFGEELHFLAIEDSSGKCILPFYTTPDPTYDCAAPVIAQPPVPSIPSGQPCTSSPNIGQVCYTAPTTAPTNSTSVSNNSTTASSNSTATTTPASATTSPTKSKFDRSGSAGIIALVVIILIICCIIIIIVVICVVCCRKRNRDRDRGETTSTHDKINKSFAKKSVDEEFSLGNMDSNSKIQTQPEEEEAKRDSWN